MAPPPPCPGRRGRLHDKSVTSRIMDWPSDPKTAAQITPSGDGPAVCDANAARAKAEAELARYRRIIDHGDIC